MHDEAATKQHAETIAARLDPAVGFDPVTILSIICFVLPLLAKCFMARHAATPENITEKLAVAMEVNPNWVRNRAARMIRRESNDPITFEQSLVLAKAVIEHALHLCKTSPPELTTYAASVRDQ